jgi:hypothetical protein
MLKRIVLIFTIAIVLIYTGFSLCKKSDNFVHIAFATWGSESEINILKPMLEDFEKVLDTVLNFD